MSAMRKPFGVLYIFLLVVMVGSYIACSQHDDAPIEHLADPDADDGHGLHAVNNARLREIMHGLSSLEMERLQADVDGGGGRDADARIERVAHSAAQLAADARVMPTAFKEIQMNSESRRVFDELASRLERQCNELEQLARRRKTHAMKTKMNEITRTCNECHASFRGPQMAASDREP